MSQMLAASRFPRLYLDADMVLSADDIRTLSESLRNGAGFLVCAPKRKMELDNRPLAVRAFFRIQQRLPVYESGLVGRGAIMVSEAAARDLPSFPMKPLTTCSSTRYLGQPSERSSTR